ncbi:MAG: hypothetical protein GX811_03105 [Lentisphaerae bacterium]|nr:hypothetical protein [Lentisphaerota bacterium]
MAKNYAVARKDNMKVFQSFLCELGRRFDCYFTVESVGATGSLNNTILDSMIYVDNESLQNIDSAMEFFNNYVVVWKDAGKTNEIRLITEKKEHNKTIIMLRDERLLTTTDYALTNAISLEYDGSPAGLLNLLSRQNDLIRPQTVFSIGMGNIKIDTQTHIGINATNESIRNILTDCIPLSEYSRVIWSSYTDGKEKSPVVTVKFHGNANK